ncbi:MAG TPA: ABC transporter ATP-binding protein [Chthoniobacterales bacterium]
MSALPPPLPTPAISVRDLHRTFGNVQAVRGISFDVFPGQVVGFIGANGAGKTTTMRILTTLDSPTSGTAEICGCDVLNYPTEVRQRIGWMPDTYGAYEYMTVAEYLDFYGRAFGLKGTARWHRVREVMDFADLTPLAQRPANKLSKGQSQRLCLGRTLLHDPEVLILDEPAAGLDPKARIEFKNLIRLLAVQGKTIFISSHILSELAEMCDTMLFIDQGQVVHFGSAENLRQHDSEEVFIDVRLAGDSAALAQWAETHPGVQLAGTHRQGGRLRMASTEPEAVAACLRQMVADGLPVLDFHREERRLEDAFVDILKRK